MFDLSIVIPTCDRPALLAAALESIHQTVQSSGEVIVVDGSRDRASDAVLNRAQISFGDRLTIVREPKREGFARAANKGFALARGQYLTWLNDDARPMPGAYDSAIEQLRATTRDVALLALFHRWQSTRNIAYETILDGQPFKLCHVRGTLYANFGIGLRSTFAHLGYFDERFYMNGADPDLSLKAWNIGLRVAPAWGCCIDHTQHEDDRRVKDRGAAEADNQRLFEKWNLPPRNLEFNDFDSRRPCTLQQSKLCKAA